MKKDLELFLSIHSEGTVQVPSAVPHGSGVWLVRHDPSGITRISVQAVDARAQIQSVTCGEVTYPNIDQIGSLWVDGQRQPGTNGWIEPGGEYRLVIRYSPKSHHYLAYLVDKFQQKM